MRVAMTAAHSGVFLDAERAILPMGRCHENAANFVLLVRPRGKMP